MLMGNGEFDPSDGTIGSHINGVALATPSYRRNRPSRKVDVLKEYTVDPIYSANDLK